MRLPGTSERVPRHTARHINERIERMTMWNLEYYAAHPHEIESRLYELEREWDVERTLEANAASLSLLGLVLGSTVSKKWYMLTGVVGGFLLQHALQGWCPPVTVLRRMGVRTESEIEMERYALKALRGDFDNLHAGGNGSPTRRIFEAVRRGFERIKGQYGESVYTPEQPVPPPPEAPQI